MSVLRGRHLAAVGAKETFTVTRPSPSEHTGLSTVLPTTEPGTSQISQTVASGDLFLPPGLSGVYVGCLIAHVVNNDAASRTVSWRLRKNGVSLATASDSVGAGLKDRVQGFFSPTAVSGDSPGTGIVAGDTLELRLWAASSANVQLTYWAFFLLDTRVRVTGCRFLQDVTLTTGAYPTLTSWPSGSGQVSNSPTQHYVGDATSMSVNPAATTLRGVFTGGYGLYAVDAGDSSFVNTATRTQNSAPNYLRLDATVTSVIARRVVGV